MSGSYWDPLADVLPEDVRAAMDKALADAIHHGKGRDGEPVLLAGVRALLKHSVLLSEHDRQIGQWARNQRSTEESHRNALDDTHRRSQAYVAEDLRRLEAVRALVNVQRKTLSMADLVAALNPDGL